MLCLAWWSSQEQCQIQAGHLKELGGWANKDGVRSRECDKSAAKPHFQNQAPNKSGLHWILFALQQFSIAFIPSHKKRSEGVARQHLIPFYCSTQKPFLTLSLCRKQNSVTDEILSNYIIWLQENWEHLEVDTWISKGSIENKTLQQCIFFVQII